MVSTVDFNKIMKNNDMKSFLEIINCPDFVNNDNLQILCHPKFIYFFKIYIDTTDSLKYGFEILVNLVLLDNKKGIDVLLEKYPNLPMFNESDDWKLEKNIMNYIIWSLNYDLYMKFTSLYPDLMNQVHDEKFPIESMCWSQRFQNVYYWAKPIGKRREKIFKHYIENSKSILPSQYAIPLQLHQYADEFLMIILRKFRDDTELLTKIFCINVLFCVSCETMGAYLDAGIDYTYDNYIIVKNQCKNLEFLNLFIRFGYVPDINTLHDACYFHNYEIFKHVYYNYNIDELPNIFDLLSFSSDQFLEIMDYPDINIFTKLEDNNILHHIFYKQLYVKNRSKIVKKLIEKGLDPYERNKNGSCFFHNVLSFEDIKTLHEIGIDLAIRDNSVDNFNVLRVLETSSALNEKKYIELANLLFSEYTFNKDDINVLLDNLDFFVKNAHYIYMPSEVKKWKKKIAYLQRFICLSDQVLQFINE